MITDQLIYKRDVNKSVLWDGFGIEHDYLPMFLSRTEPLQRGEQRTITLLFEGQSYAAIIKNLNNPADRRSNDAYQIRYPANGAFARTLQQTFCKTFRLIQEQKANFQPTPERKRLFVRIPDEYKEYIAIYTTTDPNIYVCEPILVDEIAALRETVRNQSERSFESIFNYDMVDDTAGIREKRMLVRLRKLNRKIGDYLKEHYQYRCQICGRMIGEKYGSHLVEAHHIDYFVKSLNNDMANQLIVCPNHHGIIHDCNPVYDRERKIYRYPNGYEEGFVLNDHL